MSRRQKPIYLEIAPREFTFQFGCIERMSTVPQGRGRECSRRGRRRAARVAWRSLGQCYCDVDAACRLCEWAVSCRTPIRLRGDLDPADCIGDGSAEAAAAWVRGEI